MAIKIIPQYERGIVLRFGKYIGIRDPGLRVIIPFVDSLIRVDIRTITMDVPPQDVITKDNVPVKVNAVVYFQVMAPDDAILKVENFFLATSQIAQTTLRNILGKSTLDELLANREKISHELQQLIDTQTDPWGIKVTIVEVKDIELPKTMQRAMAKQAEAERERRAKIIHAEGEMQSAEKLAEAADILSGKPASIQLRYLQTLTEISAENNSTIVFPLPLNLMKGLDNLLNKINSNK